MNMNIQDEVIEGNNLIAEFMGMPVSMLHNDLCYADWDGMHSVKYHFSWDWLMPVVEKINKIHNEVDIYKQLSKVMEALWLIDIRHLWLAVVAFIKWYNTQNQTV